MPFQSTQPWRSISRLALMALASSTPLISMANAGGSSARLHCQYSFLAITNLIQDSSCTLQPITASSSPLAPPAIPASPPLSAGPLTASPTTTHPWSFTPGWVYNPIFSCCSFSQSTVPRNDSNESSSSNASPTLITSADLSEYASIIDQGQQQVELSVSYYTSDVAPSTSSTPFIPETFRAIIRFIDATGSYITIEDSGSGPGLQELRPGDAESLLYYAFDAVTMEPARVPVGARGIVVQIVVPSTPTSFCFDYFALRILKGSFHPATESVLQKVLIGLGALVMFNATAIPLILFYGLPRWLWRSAPVNFFQKNPVVDHYVPPALFISTCQWIYNIILQYLGGSSSKISIIHSSQALWLIPLILIGTFFISAFAHWALFLCYNQVKQQARQQYHSQRPQLKAPLLGLWGALCLLLTRAGIVVLTVVQGGYWSVPIGILLAVPETVAMSSVIFFFIKTTWQYFRSRRHLSSKRISGGGSNKETHPSPSSPTVPLWDSQTAPVLQEYLHDDFSDLSSANHRAYVKSLLVPEQDLRDAAGSMYGQSTIGSDRNAALFHKATTTTTASSSSSSSPPPTKAGEGSSSRYMGSTLNTTVSMASSTATDFSRHPTEYDFNVPRDGRRLPPLSPSANYGRGSRQFPFDQPGQQQQGYFGGRRNGAPSEKSTAAPVSTRSGQNRPRPRPSSSREGLNVHKLTWNSATTSYTTASAAQPMTGAAPTPSAWEYVVYPKRHVWPTIVGTFLLIVRLPLRILVAVLTTLVLCYDVLLSIAAAEIVLAVPVSCLLGGIAYPGQSQFDNTMNVARAMHTVNLVLIVVLLPAIVLITLLHQIRMVQKYNWCLRLLRTGNYGFVPSGREYTQHLKHPVRFIGYTVGFGVVGLCFTIFLLFTLCTLVAMLLVAATFRSSIFRSLGSRALAAFGISFLLVLVLWVVQMLVIRYRFRMPGSRFLLAPQQSARSSFHHWEFFWAFFNIVFGALSFCKRIVLSVLSMGIYSTRIDLCIMGGRFRPWDGGYSAFVGLVLADHVLNNPIVLEFVQILRDLLLIRRHPNLAHYFLEGRGRTHLSDGHTSQDENSGAAQDRRLMLQMMNLQQRGGFPGVKSGGRPLADIEEGEEASMDQLLMASGAGVGAGAAVKGGVVVPEVSKIHHYFRIDQRVDRHGPGQGPLSSPSSSSSSSLSPPPAYNNSGGNNSNNNSDNRVSKVYTPLTATTDDTGNKQGIHVKLQDPHMDPDSAVSQEQIRQKLSEARLRSIRARNRWFLYLTLARNPSLCLLRRTRAKDFLHPIGRGVDHAGSHEEEFLADIQWDRED